MCIKNCQGMGCLFIDYFPLGREIDFPSDEPQGHQTMALLVTNKSGASEIAKMMFSCPGVTFALMSTLSNNTALGKGVYTISLHVKTSMLGELWAWLWGEKKSLLVTQGLVAMVMQSGTIIWVQGISTSEFIVVVLLLLLLLFGRENFKNKIILGTSV